jgi:hypothetical protein
MTAAAVTRGPVALALLLSLLLSVLPTAGLQPAAAATAPLVMVTGDSVPQYLADALAYRFRREGWTALDAATEGCGVVGVHLVNSDGSSLASGATCPEVVPPRQAQALAQDPDVVVWWDRFSLADFLTPRGEHVRAGTTRFWTLRQWQLDAAVERFSARGATVVLLATEPIGRGVYSVCPASGCHPWIQRQIQRSDWRQRWNRILRNYARDHPSTAVYRTISATVCGDDKVPCDDSLPSGPLARRDGRHYSRNGGQGLAAGAVTRRIHGVVGNPAAG